MTYLEDVGNGVLAVNLLLHDTILVHTDGSKNIQDSLVHGLQTIDDERHGNLLPSRSALLRSPTPVFRLLRLADVTDVKHDTVQRTRVQSLVLVVRGDSDQELRLAVVHLCPETVSARFGEVIGVARSGGVTHMPRNGPESQR